MTVLQNMNDDKEQIMKKIAILLTAILFAGILSAQNSTQSRTILDKAFAAYEKSKGVSFTFRITTIEANGQSYPSQSGKAMAKHNKFKLEMPDMETWFDGKTQWVWIKSTNEVNVSAPSSNEIASISPLALLNIYKSGFSLQDPISKKVNGKDVFVIQLTPTGKQGDFKQIEVAIDRKTNSIVQVKTLLKNNLKNVIDINNYNTNYHFDDSIFVFNSSLHPEAEIVDLR